MSELNLSDISEAMRDIDICMLATKTPSGDLEARPMSNNREVEYKGDSYFFAYDHCSAAKEIMTDHTVNLAYINKPVVLGKDLYISVSGKAELIKDRAVMEKHWVKDLEIWFEDGLDTKGLVMIHVKANRIKYWHGYEEGEVTL